MNRKALIVGGALIGLVVILNGRAKSAADATTSTADPTAPPPWVAHLHNHGPWAVSPDTSRTGAFSTLPVVGGARGCGCRG